MPRTRSQFMNATDRTTPSVGASYFPERRSRICARLTENHTPRLLEISKPGTTLTSFIVIRRFQSMVIAFPASPGLDCSRFSKGDVKSWAYGSIFELKFRILIL